MQMKLKVFNLLFWTVFTAGAWGQGAPVGVAVAARGAVTAADDAGTVRLLGPQSPVHAGEVITTGRKSFAILELEDGTRMTLRPETVFEVEDYATEPHVESAVVRLFKGGLRAVTGFISKRDPDAFKVRTSVATIGIRGTEFDARLCAEDCGAEAQKRADVRSAAPARAVVARVALVRGRASGIAADGGERALVVGSPLHAGDTVRTGRDAIAVLAFRDRGRVTVSPDSALRVDEYRFDNDEPAGGSAVMSLLRGGLRAVTGLIGRNRPESYRIRTAVATIGIRGTGFDLACVGACAAEAGLAGLDTAPLAPLRRLLGLLVAEARAAVEGGLYASVWQGSIVFLLDSGALVVEEGKVAYFDGSDLTFLPSLPVTIEGPRPDEVEVDPGLDFDAEAADAVPPGLYVACYEGHCDVEGLHLGDGEAARVSEDGSTRVRLEIIPPFQFADPWLDEGALQLYDELLRDVGDGEFECTIL